MKINFLTPSWDFLGKINEVLIFGNAQAPLGQFFGHLTMDGIMGSAERHTTLVAFVWRNKNSAGKSVLFLRMRIFNI